MKNPVLILTLLCLVPSFAQSIEQSKEVDPIDFLKELVSHSSATNEVDGVTKVQSLVKNRLTELGFAIEERSAEDLSITSRQLVATRMGKTPRFITFVTHADTVFDKSNSFEISPDRKIIKGPGVGDDKGGIVVAVFALEKFLAKNVDTKYSVRFIVSPTEETGSSGFRNSLKIFSKDSELVLGMEPALEDGSIVKARKGARWYQIEVQGEEAHAGVNPEAGVNACAQLSIFVEKISKLNDFKSGTTVTVGQIEGGKKFNIVCGQAAAKIDVRFLTEKAKNSLHRSIEAILKKPTVKSEKTGKRAQAKITIVTEVPPFSVSPDSKKLVSRYLEILRSTEFKPIQAVLTGGAADLNYMGDNAVLMLDGLGPVGGGYHTRDEYIELSSIASRIQALSEFLEWFNRDHQTLGK